MANTPQNSQTGVLLSSTSAGSLSSSSSSTMASASSASSLLSSNIDPIAVLKRVENLKKWQEEEQKKLLQAHEEQLQQIRMQKVMHFII